MLMQGASGSLWRSLASSSAIARSHGAVGGQHTTSRHASTSRVTLDASKSAPRAKIAPERRTNAQASLSDTASGSSNVKQRRLPPQQAGRGVGNQFIDEAKRDMQMRRMPYDAAELQWLREARLKVFTLTGKQNDLQAEQKQLTANISRIMHAERKANKNGDSEAKSSSAEVDATERAASSEKQVQESDQGKSCPKSDKNQDVQKLRERARKIREELDSLSKQREEITARSLQIRLSWPNHCHPDVPIGPEENAVLVSVRDPLNILPTEFDVMKESWNKSALQAKDFPDGPRSDRCRDHLHLIASTTHAEVDTMSGSLATGNSWPYLLGSISLLEHALSQYAMSIVVRKGFLAVSPPDVVRVSLADRCGFRPRDEKAKQTYFLENHKASDAEQEPEDVASAQQDQVEDQLCLAATAEIPLAGLLAGRILGSSKKAGKRAKSGNEGLIQDLEFPIKLAALGHAFRAEAGARGADTRGLYRVHQFSKIEMFVATHGDLEKSNAMLEELRGVQEEIIGGLGLPYRVLDMPTEELGASAYRKYDIEVWMPGRGSWGEVSSASNCTDYQALRLGIKIKRTSSDSTPDAKFPTVHTLNATAAAIPRLIVAILENHGVENGKLVLPDTLKPFWLAGDKDPNVTWLPTGGANAGSQSRLQRALTQVRSIAKKNGTDAPTMVASFFILHELTAIVPLALLFYVFGALGVGTAVLQWLLGEDRDGADHGDEGARSFGAKFRQWARIKEERFERYCRRKGYLGFEKQDAEAIDQARDLGNSSHLAGSFANLAAAYILVKALIPVRIGASVALAGPFSRSVLEPLKNMARRLYRRPAKASVSSS